MYCNRVNIDDTDVFFTDEEKNKYALKQQLVQDMRMHRVVNKADMNNFKFVEQMKNLEDKRYQVKRTFNESISKFNEIKVHFIK